jgi:hypothetical protein
MVYVQGLAHRENRASIFTTLSIVYVAEDTQPRRTRSTGERVRFHYYLPFVGCACKPAFMDGYVVSAPAVARYRRAIIEGTVLEDCEDQLLTAVYLVLDEYGFIPRVTVDRARISSELYENFASSCFKHTYAGLPTTYNSPLVVMSS